MKNTITLLISLLISISTFAQTGFNYKAVIKDGSGNIVTGQEIDIRFTIEYDAGIEFGIITQYKEIHNPTTDSNGIVILNIGEGLIISGTFPQTSWIYGSYLITEIDIEKDGTFVTFPITYFKPVPMANRALRADIATTANNVAFEKNFSTNTISNSVGNVTQDDFVFGSSQLNYSGQSNRFFFDKSKGAFRAGFANGNQWDSGNVGNYSTAFGFVTEAKGDRSTALGSGTIASRFASTAIGNYNADDQNALFMVGNGTGSTNRNNAFTVKDNGDTVLDGKLQHTNTGSRNMIPIAYGIVDANANITNGTGNFNVVRTSSPITYRIEIPNITLSWTNTVVFISPLNKKTFSIDISSGYISITFETPTNPGSGLSPLSSFNFVVYQL